MNNSPPLNHRISEILHNLFVVFKQLRLHHQENAIVKDSTAILIERLNRYWAEGNSIHVSVAKHNFLVSGIPLDPKNRIFAKFSYRLFQHGISSFSITSELTTHSLYSFLRLMMSKPTATWDQGGACKCMELQNIVGIQATEMSKSDFLLLENSSINLPLEQIKSSKDFWNRFAKSLLNSLSGSQATEFDPDKASISEFAQKVNELLAQDQTASEWNKTDLFEQELTRSILAAQGQNKKTERIASYLKLADFINHLDGGFRQKIIGDLCNLHLLEANAASFFSALSDEALLEALNQATEKKNNVSPVIMALITKLAVEKQLVPADSLTHLQEQRTERIKKAKEVLSFNNFEEHIPKPYQKTLLQILSNQQLPEVLDHPLQQLKKQLETSQLERQMAKLTVHLLHSQPDQTYLPILQQQLIKSMEFYLGTSDYAGLLDVCLSGLNNRSQNEIEAFARLIPTTFYQHVLRDASRLGKEYHASINAIIDLLSPYFIEPLLEIMSFEQNRSARLLFLNQLRLIGKKQNISDQIVHYLKDENWYVIRNMLFLLGQLGAKDKLLQIRDYLHHDHHRVRQEALKTCLLLNDSKALTQLYLSLFSKDRQEVLNAISMSDFINAPELTNKLLHMLKHEKFFSFDLEVKKSLVLSLAKKQDKQALLIFAKKLKRQRIFQAKSYQKFKLEIIRALHHYSADQVIPLLQQLNNSTGSTALQAKQVMHKLQKGEKR